MDYKRSLREMIRSCYTYWSAEIGSYYYNKYILPYREHLSAKVFESTYNNEMSILKWYAVNVWVYTDSEWVTYNSLSLK